MENWERGITDDALMILDRRIGDDDDLRQMVAEEGLYAHLAQLVYKARTRVGLTQKELADRIGVAESTVARLEDADCGPRSFTLVRKVAAALDLQLELRWAPRRRSTRHDPHPAAAA